MRAKTAVWAVPLAVFVAAGWSGNCFSQSSYEPGASEERLLLDTSNLTPLVIAAALPSAILPIGLNLDSAEESVAENAGPEAAEPAPVPVPKRPGQVTSSKVGIGIKISTLGVGIEAAVPVTGKLNVRGGFNFLRLNQGISSDGIRYDGHVHFQSAEAHLDWFPFGGFHISPGLLFYNGNSIIATAAVPGGQTFSVGGTSYESDPATPVTGTGSLNFVKVSPSIMIGVGNLIPRNGRHYSFLFEVGGAYQGSARVALNLVGNVCDTNGTNCRSVASDSTVQANIAAQQLKIRNDVNPYKFFPVVSLGVGFNF
jgi:hypothetical protein